MLLPVYASAPTNTSPEGKNGTVVTRNDINRIISRNAVIYGVETKIIQDVINCESGFNPDAQNITEKEKSYGLVQINLLAHPTITEEQAKDPEFAVEFLAKNLAKNKGNLWTCYAKMQKM